MLRWMGETGETSSSSQTSSRDHHRNGGAYAWALLWLALVPWSSSRWSLCAHACDAWLEHGSVPCKGTTREGIGEVRLHILFSLLLGAIRNGAGSRQWGNQDHGHSTAQKHLKVVQWEAMEIIYSPWQAGNTICGHRETLTNRALNLTIVRAVANQKTRTRRT